MYGASSEGREGRKVFTCKDGTVPIFDDPDLKGGIRPWHRAPLLQFVEIRRQIERKQITEDDLCIINTIGSGRFFLEFQLREIFQEVFTNTYLGERLRKLYELGILDQWVLTNDYFVDREKVIGWSIGASGAILLQYGYGRRDIISPEHLVRQGLQLALRYGALNQIRIQMHRSGHLKQWIWHPVINNTPAYGTSMALAVVEGPSGDLFFLFERLVQGMDAIGYANRRIGQLNKMISELSGPIVFKKTYEYSYTTSTMPYLVWSVGCDSFIPYLLARLNGTPIPYMFLSDEFLHKYGLAQAFQIIDGQGQRKRVEMPLFQAATEVGGSG